jgi:hypothetical protein
LRSQHFNNMRWWKVSKIMRSWWKVLFDTGIQKLSP